MATLEVRGSAIHTQCLLSKAIVKNKVTTSDLIKCLRNISNRTDGSYNSQNSVYLRHINQILDGQNSKALNKKREILSKISMLTARDKGNPWDSNRRMSETHRWSETASYASVFSEADNMSLISGDNSYHHIHLPALSLYPVEKKETIVNDTLNSELKHAFEKRQQSKTSTIDDILKRTREAKLDTENKKTPTEFEAVFSKVQGKSAKAKSQVIAERPDETPEYATVQKRPQIHTLDEMQSSIKTIMHSIDTLFELSKMKNEKNACCMLNIVAGDINNVLDKLNNNKTLSYSEIQEAKEITNECLKEIYTLNNKISAIGDAGLKLNNLSDCIKDTTLMTQRHLSH